MTGRGPAVLRTGSGRPVLWVVAGMHGDEVEGIACVEDALATIRPERGTLVGVPVAHPAALAAGTRCGPDGVDLNRAFPGRARGRPTEVVAHELWTALAAEADALLTLHSWGRAGCVVPYVEFAAGDAPGRDLALALGLPFAEPWDWPEGLLPKVAAAAGTPAVELELGGLGRRSPEGTALGVRAVRAAAAALGMLPSGVLPATRLVRRHELRATMAGHVRQLVALGEPVDAGRPLCEVRDARGKVLEILSSPVAGWAAAHDTYGAVEPGARVAIVFAADDDA